MHETASHTLSLALTRSHTHTLFHTLPHAVTHAFTHNLTRCHALSHSHSPAHALLHQVVRQTAATAEVSSACERAEAQLRHKRLDSTYMEGQLGLTRQLLAEAEAASAMLADTQASQEVGQRPH